jgi:hypothetical protein
MIVTKKTPDHVVIETEDINGKTQHLEISAKKWQELRNLTPEARALKELVELLDDQPRIPRAPGYSSELLSALQEGRALVKRMEPQRARAEESGPIVWHVVDTNQFPLGTVTRDAGDPPREGLLQVGDATYNVIQTRPVHVVVVEKAEVADG